jgi:FKBP-type peptidyl-prolyl cis-trans isomerase FklB
MRRPPRRFDLFSIDQTKDESLNTRNSFIRSAIWVFAVFASAAVASVFGDALAAADDDVSLMSYSLGHQIGTDLVRHERPVDLDALARGLHDGSTGKASAYSDEELDAVLLTLKQQIVTTERADRIRGAPTLRHAGREFMAGNAAREDVKTLDSGLQYRVIRRGEGKRAAPTDRVKIRYRSWRIDGTVFHDSTQPESEPETMRVGELIRGLREALPLMGEGARWEIFIPPDLAFERRGPLADHTVVYDLELLAVGSGEAAGSEVTQ